MLSFREDASEHLGLQQADYCQLPTSQGSFPDGSQYRVEIASVEDSRCLSAVIDAAAEFQVPVCRVSQGSGVTLLDDAEIERMVRLAANAGIELSLFARPNASWTDSAMSRSPAGSVIAASAHGVGQLTGALDEIRRAADLGVRSVLIADLGVLSAFSKLREASWLPADMKAKTSVMLPAANPLAARVLVDLGADTLNLPTDTPLHEVANIRAAVDVPLDIYIEAPDNLGGMMRYHQLRELVQVAAPVHIKFGLRNSPDVYPAGSHLSATAAALCRERTRRARVALDALKRSQSPSIVGRPGGLGLAIPKVNAARQ